MSERTVSNHAMQRLLIQTKPAISQPGDQFEQEADRVADQVMRMPEPQLSDGSADGTEITPIATASVQRACKDCEEEEASGPPMVQRKCTQCAEEASGLPVVQRKCATCEEDLHRQAIEEQEEETVQTKKASHTTPDITPDVQARLNGLRGNGQPLPNSARTFFEPRFGRDFSSVRVHTGHEASALARAVQSRAFTSGNNVVFRSSEYMPGTTAGNRLLAHELTHVIQQGHAGQLNSVQRSGEESAGQLANIQRTSVVTEIHSRSSEGSIQRAPAQCNAENNEGFPKIDTNSRVRDAVGYAQRKLNLFMRDYDHHRAEAAQINPKAGAFMDRERAKIKPPKAPENPDDALDVDCDFGRSTTAATKVFQAAMFPNSSEFKAGGPEDSAWDGVIGSKTWPKLESVKPPLRVKIVGFFFSEHQELLDNKTDWSSAGTKYSQTNAIQTRFDPVIQHALADPITLSADTTVSGVAILNVLAASPGTELTLTATPSLLPTGEAPAWTLSGSDTINGPGMEFITLTANAPLPGETSYRDFALDWTLSANQQAGQWLAFSGHEAFMIPGNPTDVESSNHKPTYKRMSKAIEFGSEAPSLRPDDITFEVMKVYDSYGECAAPKDPDYPKCPDVTELWEVSDYPEIDFQCITIAQYAAAVLNVLGVPSRWQMEVKPVVVYARSDDPDVGVESATGHGMRDDPKYCFPGHPAQVVGDKVRCPKGPGWTLALIDSNGRANNFEACTKLRWNSPQGWVCQYFCGGARHRGRPMGDFSCPSQILHYVFGDGLWYQVTPRHPTEQWPPADLKQRVRTYSGFIEKCKQSDMDRWCNKS